MSDQYRPPERNTPAPKSNNLGFIVGGLVVAVGLLLWFVLGDGVPTGANNGDSTTNVTVETPAAPAPAEPAPAAPAPADAAPAAPAPAAPAPAAPPAP